MDYFSYINGRLFAEQVPIERIIDEVGTPVYIYSKTTFLEHLRKIQQAYKELDTTICYSVKACNNIHILRFLAEAGSGFDIVSGGELYRLKLAGARPDKIVYAGVGKTQKEICEALEVGIAYFNIESEAELETLINLARQKRKLARAAIRVNPDIEYQTHKYLKTATHQTKFGIDVEKTKQLFNKYANNKFVRLRGIHIHLGTGGKSVTPYLEAVEKALPLIDELRNKGHTIESLNLGGGYGADYESNTAPSAAEYADAIVPLIKQKNLHLILEPGKSIAANAGILVTKVLYTKTSGAKKFAIVDAAMNDLIRPCLYDAFHFIWPVSVEDRFIPQKRLQDLQLSGTEKMDIVGPICEGADFFAKDRHLPPVKRGDLLAIFTAGAYGFTMSSNYNARCRVPEVLVENGSFKVIRRRETYEDLVAAELL